ncbi:hypothetical protein NQ314_007652, partial [Rhamnusium bicolor]
MSAMCKICEKEFSSQFNLNKHLKNVHKTKPVAVSYKKSVWSYKCEEPSCNSSFYRNQGLIDHLLMCHNMKLKVRLDNLRRYKHIRLSRADRNAAASKLAAAVPKERILGEIRDNIGNQLKRVNLIIKQDLQNVKRSFKIDMQEGVRNKDDATILLYKREGDILESFPLEENDFCLIIMSQYQQHMLVKYGNNIIAVDGTYGLNNYDFKLTTLMVVDNFNEGFPGAFMFTNRKDTLIHQIFFEVIESKVGNKISPNTFMSDITGVFYQAWSSVMGVVPFQLYCTWHIDRAWRNNLNKIPNIEKKERGLQNFKKSMHKQIKYFYLHGTPVKRLDKGLYAVLQYSRDKMVEHLIKETKGKSSIHKKNILQRHTTAISSQFSAESIENSE